MAAITQRQMYIAVIGTGGVGKAFLTQLEALAHRYLSHPSSPTDISLIYATRSRKSLISTDYKPITLQAWEDQLDASSTPPLGPADLIEFLGKAPGKAVIVDNTSSQQVAETYPVFLQHGISVVTPNKKAFSSDLTLWDAIYSTAANGSSSTPQSAGYVFHESTVGAGLPILCTLKDLLETGDIVTKIEGVLSGTMSFLFNNFMPVGGGGGSFSAEVNKAKELGYTEPDPRDDLNGMDVARKLTILGRLAGVRLASPSSFEVQSLIPKELENVSSGDEFLARLPEYEGVIEGIKKEAQAEGRVLRYVGSIDVHAGTAEVGLKKFDASHPIAALKGSDNILSFHTKRYGHSPLTIQGAGAGGEITAMGVTADLIRVFGLVL